MKVTVLGCGSSGGVPLIGNYWGECDPKNVKNNRTRVSIVINKDNKNILIDTSPDLKQQLISENPRGVNNNNLWFSLGPSDGVGRIAGLASLDRDSSFSAVMVIIGFRQD